MPDSGLRVVFGPEKAPQTGRPRANIPLSFADGCLDLNGCSNPEHRAAAGQQGKLSKGKDERCWDRSLLCQHHPARRKEGPDGPVQGCDAVKEAA